MGPGIGREKETQKLVVSMIQNYQGTMIVDADALYAVAEQKMKWENKDVDIVITPHVGEFARLTGHEKEDIEKNRIDEAIRYATDNQIIVVLKGAPTVIAFPDGHAWVNSTGNPCMATGGMGDVLTGVIASLVAQGMSVEKAAVTGVYLHGRSADLLSKVKSIGMTAEEVARYVREARKEISEHHMG